MAPSEVPAPGSVNAPQKDTANVSVAVGATYVVETTSPYGPPFVVSGSGDPLIATVRGMTTDPGGVHSVEVTGVAEGSTTWDVVWDDYSTAPYSFGLSVSITVTAGSGTPPVAVPVERALVTVGATHTVDVGYQPTVSKTDGDDGLVTATPTTTGATFTGVAAGSATFRLEWTNGDAETQQRDVVITVTDGNVPTDTLELEIGGQIDVPSGGISAVTVTHLGGDEDVATVTAYHENRVHGARAAGNETGVATWRMTWQNYGQGEVAGLRHLYIEVLAEASTDSLTVAVGAFDTVTVGHQPTVEHTGGDANSARVTATSTGAEILGLAQGTSEHLLTWDDPSLMPSKQRKRLTLTVPEPPPPPVDSIKRLKIGRSHEVNVGYEPVSVSYTSGNERIVTAAATSTGATITAVGEGTASLRLMWLDANSITWMRDVVVTVPPPPPPIADSPILALGDTIFWDNNGLPRNDVRHVSGDAGIVKIEPYIESGRTGVRIVGRSAGFGVYEIETFVTSPRIAFVKRKLYITVLASLPGGKQALDLIDSDRSVQEGDTVYVRAILQAPADGEVRIPLTLTAQPLPASVGRHGYAEEALTNRDAAFLDSNATTIVIADGDQYGTVGVVVVDDAHVEPASSEVVRITAIVPNDVELASRGSYADLRIAEGVCDRHPGLHRSYRIGAIQDARWYGSECYELTDGAISSIKTFAANLGNSQKTADFKFGDFAGLTAVKRFTLAGFEGEGSAWSNSLFRDLNAVEHLTLSDWQLHTIPTQMFHGINAAVKSAMLHMDAHGNDDPTREVNAVVIAAGAFGPLSGVDRIELGGFHATRLTRSSMRVFAGVKDVRIRDFPHLTTINDDAFKDLSNLTQLRLVNLPQLGDRGLPDGLLRAQVATLEGLYLNNLGLVAKRMHRLFSGVTPPTALINLDLTGNRYATARYVARALTFPNLRGLHFESNRIATLDPAAFEGINLTTLHLNKNPGAPFQIASRLQVKDDTLVRVRTDASLPAALSFRVYGQNLDGDELSLSIPPGSNYSDWTSVTRTDQSQQVLLRATLGESLSDDITGLALAFSEQGAGEAILYRQPGQGGNRLPVIVKDFGDIGLSLGSTTRPEVATWTADLTSYVRGEVATRALTYSANSADTTVATAVVDGAELTVSGVAMGTTVITVTAADGPQSLSLTIAVEVEQIDGTNFNIQIVKVGDAQREPLSSVIDRAAAYWESALRDAPDVPLDPNGSRLSCRGFRLPERQSVVDDIIMIIGAISIDGDGGTLASASVCVERDGSYGNASELPVMGRFVMDRADMDYLNSTPGGTYGTVLHEMGHLLGIGWTWYDKAPIGGLSYDPGGDRYHSASRYPFVAGFSPNKLLNGADIAYLGVQAFEGWKDSGGTRSLFPLDGAPIATEGGGGSFGVHWSEARMRSELMTPYKNHPSPLSAVTFNSLTDLGWTVSTDFTAEAYRVPGAAPEVSADAAADQGTAIDLSNDVLWVPVTRVSRDGQVTDLYEPPQMNSPENLRILDLIDAALRRAGLRLDDPF
ncbi:hypothetical protein [Candidatus Palauibacter sp.]|uniref:Ig-like domain-containing protein n=1 Tax=Candidatus Palauibacter sp. TaxID=3101350 RepID=UPI003C6EBF8C